MMAESPFPAEPAAEIPLASAPLVRVVTQLRFSTIASLTRMEFIAPFQESLRGTYPTMNDQRGVQFAFGPDGVVETQGDRQWKLTSDDGWTVVLGPSFVSLETVNYQSRANFLTRLAQVVTALRLIVDEIEIERLGVRYTDRLVGDYATELLPKLVRTDVVGLAAGAPPSVAVLASVTQAEFALADSSTMTTRWGLLPAGGTLTPDIQPVEEVSWVLDIDCAVTNLRLSEDVIMERSEQLCIHAHDFFRWVVTDEFIRAHGGEI